MALPLLPRLLRDTGDDDTFREWPLSSMARSGLLNWERYSGLPLASLLDDGEINALESLLACCLFDSVSVCVCSDLSPLLLELVAG